MGDVLASFFTWAAQQELESIRRRTKAGLDKAQERMARPWELRGR